MTAEPSLIVHSQHLCSVFSFVPHLRPPPVFSSIRSHCCLCTGSGTQRQHQKHLMHGSSSQCAAHHSGQSITPRDMNQHQLPSSNDLPSNPRLLAEACHHQQTWQHDQIRQQDNRYHLHLRSAAHAAPQHRRRSLAIPTASHQPPSHNNIHHHQPATFPRHLCPLEKPRSRQWSTSEPHTLHGDRHAVPHTHQRSTDRQTANHTANNSANISCTYQQVGPVPEAT
jgi:hypothetical protein